MPENVRRNENLAVQALKQSKEMSLGDVDAFYKGLQDKKSPAAKTTKRHILPLIKKGLPYRFEYGELPTYYFGGQYRIYPIKSFVGPPFHNFPYEKITAYRTGGSEGMVYLPELADFYPTAVILRNWAICYVNSLLRILFEE